MKPCRVNPRACLIDKDQFLCDGCRNHLLVCGTRLLPLNRIPLSCSECLFSASAPTAVTPGSWSCDSSVRFPQPSGAHTARPARRLLVVRVTTVPPPNARGSCLDYCHAAWAPPCCPCISRASFHYSSSGGIRRVKAHVLCRKIRCHYMCRATTEVKIDCQ